MLSKVYTCFYYSLRWLMKKNIKVLEDKNRVIDPWEDYINHNYENLSTFQKILRPIIIFSIATFVLIFIIGFLLVKTGQW